MKSLLKIVQFIPNTNRWITIFWIAIYALIIFQDFLYSFLRNTGFYWSEVILHNVFWLLFIPTTFIVKRFIKFNFAPNNTIAKKGIIILILSISFSVLHILFFSAYFAFTSYLIFSPPHTFYNTLISSISSDFHITFLAYFFMAFFFSSIKKNETLTYLKTILVKQGNKQIQLEVISIYFIQADKPYTTLHTLNEKFLLQQSLKSIEKTLNPQQFLRVHRSTIVNRKYIKELISRKNGDYDVLLSNDKTIRLSRHYRKNWQQLIHPSSEH